MSRLWEMYKAKARDIRPFLRTKQGRILAILGALDFLILFVAPLMHGFVGVAIFGCVASVYLILMWRKYDREHVIVPALLLCIPLLLDMLIYVGHDQIRSIVVGCLVAIIAMLIVAFSPRIGFFDTAADMIASLLTAGALCVAVVVLACLMLVLVSIAWWILCIIAFFIVVAIFLGVVFSTAAYTASDGRRQARRDRERREAAQRQQDEADAAPARRSAAKIYDLNEDDFTDIEE